MGKAQNYLETELNDKKCVCCGANVCKIVFFALFSHYVLQWNIIWDEF